MKAGFLPIEGIADGVWLEATAENDDEKVSFRAIVDSYINRETDKGQRMDQLSSSTLRLMGYHVADNGVSKMDYFLPFSGR